MNHVLRITALGGLLWLGTGCASLPSLQNFANQTGQMVSTLNQTYKQTETALASQQPARAKKLQTAWKPTEQTLTALAAYSDALAALTIRGTNSQATAKAFADKFQDLGQLVQTIYPVAGTSITEVSKLLEVTARQMVAVKVQRSLHQAVGQAQPALHEMVAVLNLNLNDLGTIANELVEQERDALRLQFAPALTVYDSKTAELRVITTEIAALNRFKTNRRPADLEETKVPAQPAATLDRRVLDRENALLAQQKAVEATRQQFEGQFKEYQTATAQLAERQNQHTQVVAQSRKTLAAWLEAHGKIAEAISLNQQVSLRELAFTVEALQKLYEFYDRKN
jgi:hypothetical protein